MSDRFSVSASRRAVLAVGTASLATLAGCAAIGAPADDGATLDRLVLRTDTGRAERLELYLVYAPPDGSTVQPVRGIYEVPASGEIRVVDDFDGTPGFYSLTAYAPAHESLEIQSFNSYSNAVEDTPLQIEVVIKHTGGVWTNLNDAGASISIP